VDQPKLWKKGPAWVETNMLHPSWLPAPYDAIIVRFLFLFQPHCNDSDVAAFLANYAWEFQLLHKTIQREPVLRCAAKGDMCKLVDDFGQPNCNGTIRPYARSYSFQLGDRAIYIPPLTTFKLKLIGNPIIPVSDIDFYPILDGTLDMPVVQ
jgi:hypothetical protein